MRQVKKNELPEADGQLLAITVTHPINQSSVNLYI